MPRGRAPRTAARSCAPPDRRRGPRTASLATEALLGFPERRLDARVPLLHDVDALTVREHVELVREDRLHYPVPDGARVVPYLGRDPRLGLLHALERGFARLAARARGRHAHRVR